MSVGMDDVERISQLAKLRLDAEEKKKMSQDLTEILEYFAQVEEVDTSSVSPMFHPVDTDNVWREDAVSDAEMTSEVLREAPQTSDGFFVVPQTVTGAKEEQDE